MSMPNHVPSANILVVDDTAANLQLLTGMFKERGYKVRPVTSGEMALRAIEAQIPDLIFAGCDDARHGWLRSLSTAQG